MILKRTLIPSLLSLLSILQPSASFGAKASFVGVDSTFKDSFVPWRDPSLNKAFDGDHDQIYGTLGYILFATDTQLEQSTAQNYTANGNPLLFKKAIEADELKTLIDLPDNIVAINGKQDKIYAYQYVTGNDPAGVREAVIFGMAGIRQLPKGENGELMGIEFTAPRNAVRLGILARPSSDSDGIATVAVQTDSETEEGKPYAERQKMVIYFFDITEIKAGDHLTLLAGKTKDSPGQDNCLYYGIVLDEVK